MRSISGRSILSGIEDVLVALMMFCPVLPNPFVHLSVVGSVVASFGWTILCCSKISCAILSLFFTVYSLLLKLWSITVMLPV